jgi:hypothetical protein
MKAHRNSAGNTVASLGVRHPEMPAEFATLRESLISDLWLMWFYPIRKLEIALGSDSSSSLSTNSFRQGLSSECLLLADFCLSRGAENDPLRSVVKGGNGRFC